MSDRFWSPTGAANWGDSNVWATTDGGDPTGIATPTSSDDVYFTSTNVNNCAVAATANCLSISFSGGTGYSGTFSGSSALNVYGSFTLDSAMNRTYTGTITFAATGTGKTITCDTKTLASNVTFDGSGGGWTLQDTFNISTSKNLTVTNGTLDTNGKTVTCQLLTVGTAGSLTLGESSVTCGDHFVTAGSATVSGASSTITCSCSSGNTTYFSSHGTCDIGTIIIKPASPSYIKIYQPTSMVNLTLDGTLDARTTAKYYLMENITVTGTFTVTGNSGANRLLVCSSSDGLVPAFGTSRTISAATSTCSNGDFMDITGAGTATWDFSGSASVGDCGGNTNITCTTADDFYWHVDGGNFNDATKWFTATNGGGDAGRCPLPQDNAIFDANSFDSSSMTVTVNEERIGNFTFASAQYSPTFGITSLALYVFGNMNLSNAVLSCSKTINFLGRSSYTLTAPSSGTFREIVALGVSGTLIFSGNSSLGTYTLTLTNGTVDCATNNPNLTLGKFSSSNSNIRTLSMGSGTWLFSGSSGTVWDISTKTNLTLNEGTSTIEISVGDASARTFAGNSDTYNNITYSGSSTGSLTISGTNIFNTLTVDSSSTAKTLLLTNGTTQTITSLSATGSSGKVITINSSSAGSAATLTKSSAGTVDLDYVSLKDITATRASNVRWFAGSRSTNTSGNSGWAFIEASNRGPGGN